MSHAPNSTVAATGLLILAVAFTLYFAAGLLIPIVFATLLKLLLSPTVRWLERRGIPNPISAAVLVGAMVTLVVLLVIWLAEPAERWLADAPTSIREIKNDMFSAQDQLAGIRELADEVEQLTAGDEAERQAQQVVVRGPSVLESLLGGLPSVATFTGIVVFLTYFLLASGDTLMRRTVKFGRTWRERRRLVTIARQLQFELSRYLLTVTAINLTLGAVVAFALYLLGVPNATLWGVMVALFNFAPYLGALTSMMVLTLVGFTTFDSTADSLMVPGVFLLLTILEGHLITPTILGRRLALSPIFVFLAVVVWGWLWGAAGALMAVPIVTCLKVICDHLPGLQPISDFMRGGRDVAEPESRRYHLRATGDY